MSTSRRNAVGESDPIKRTCSCEPNAGGTVISFYKYVKLDRAAEVADEIVAFGAKQPPGALTGKIRVAREGINASLAASEPSTMKAFTDFIESLDALALKGEGAVDYKPEPGCAHLFPNLSVRFVDELCPFGERELGVKESENIDSLTPERWHEALASRKEGESYVLDVRNFYESRVGSFAGADLAPIRRFSQLKEWFSRACRCFEGEDGKEGFVHLLHGWCEMRKSCHVRSDKASRGTASSRHPQVGGRHCVLREENRQI
jgi:predicted sulfurtransferase